MLVVAAGYLLWIGAFAPGGAFQGGALLGGALVLGLLGGKAPVGRHLPALRVGLVLGLVLFSGAAVASAALSGSILRYPLGSAGTWILVIESAALITIGLTLGLLYLCGKPDEEGRRD